ncbi:hypothetical protein [Kitasatospora sp. NPDC004289]
MGELGRVIPRVSRTRAAKARLETGLEPCSACMPSSVLQDSVRKRPTWSSVSAYAGNALTDARRAGAKKINEVRKARQERQQGSTPPDQQGR